MKKKMILSENRSATTIPVKIHDDVLDDLEHVAQTKGMTGCQSLIRFYVGQGLRKDLAELQKRNPDQEAKKALGKCNVDPRIIDEVMAAMS